MRDFRRRHALRYHRFAFWGLFADDPEAPQRLSAGVVIRLALNAQLASVHDLFVGNLADTNTIQHALSRSVFSTGEALD